MIRVLSMISNLYVLVWLAGALLGAWAKVPLGKAIQTELRPLYLPAVVISHVTAVMLHGDPFNAWRLFGTACGIANYWFFRDDDDDRWKRRRKKLVEKISRQGSRLVAVPAGGAS